MWYSQYGADESVNPVDTQFKLRGTKNVYIMDASVFPNYRDPVTNITYPLQTDGNTIRGVNGFSQIFVNQF